MHIAARNYLSLVAGLLPLLAAIGCQHLTMREPGYEATDRHPRRVERVTDDLQPTNPQSVEANLKTDQAPPRRDVEVASSSEAAANPLATQQQDLVEILAELEEIGETDPQLQRELMTSVREMIGQSEQDPLMWARMRGTIMAAISYRKQQRSARDSLDADIGKQATPPVRRVEEPSTAPSPSSVADASPEGTATAASIDLHQPESVSSATSDDPIAASQITTPRIDAVALLTQTPSATTPDIAERLANLQRGAWGFGTSGTPVSIDGADDAFPSALSADWTAHLQQAIATLEAQTDGAPQTSEEINRHAALRTLYMLAGRREQAVAPIDGIAPELQDFWSNQLYGLSMVRDTATITDPARRATEAATHLRFANQRLGEAGVLEIRNLAFCRTAQGFGLYEPLAPRSFQAGQQVVLYLEVENFRTSPSEQGHALSLAGKYQIVDQRGKLVFSGELGEYKEQCRTRRRDLYYSSLIQLPGSLAAGDYNMQVSIEDKIGRKAADAAIEFSIAARSSEARR